MNAHLRAVGLSLNSDRGLPGDGWSRQLLFAADPDNGYAALPLPAVRLALRAGDLEETERRVRELADRLQLAGEHLAEARRVVTSRVGVSP